MKTLHVLIGLVLLAALLAGCVWVISTAFQGPEVWSGFVEQAKGYPLYAASASLILAILLLLFVLTSIRLPEKNQYIAYDIEGSTVSISMKAVQDFLSRLAGEFAAIESLHPAIRANNGSVDVQMDVKIRAGAQIPELCRMLQERARATLRDKVGLSDVREVRVRVQELVGPASVETKPGERPETFAS